MSTINYNLNAPSFVNRRTRERVAERQEAEFELKWNTLSYQEKAKEILSINSEDFSDMETIPGVFTFFILLKEGIYNHEVEKYQLMDLLRKEVLSDDEMGPVSLIVRADDFGAIVVDQLKKYLAGIGKCFFDVVRKLTLIMTFPGLSEETREQARLLLHFSNEDGHIPTREEEEALDAYGKANKSELSQGHNLAFYAKRTRVGDNVMATMIQNLASDGSINSEELGDLLGVPLGTVIENLDYDLVEDVLIETVNAMDAWEDEEGEDFQLSPSEFYLLADLVLTMYFISPQDAVSCEEYGRVVSAYCDTVKEFQIGLVRHSIAKMEVTRRVETHKTLLDEHQQLEAYLAFEDNLRNDGYWEEEMHADEDEDRVAELQRVMDLENKMCERYKVKAVDQDGNLLSNDQIFQEYLESKGLSDDEKHNISLTRSILTLPTEDLIKACHDQENVDSPCDTSPPNESENGEVEQGEQQVESGLIEAECKAADAHKPSPRLNKQKVALGRFETSIKELIQAIKKKLRSKEQENEEKKNVKEIDLDKLTKISLRGIREKETTQHAFICFIKRAAEAYRKGEASVKDILQTSQSFGMSRTTETMVSTLDGALVLPITITQDIPNEEFSALNEASNFCISDFQGSIVPNIDQFNLKEMCYQNNASSIERTDVFEQEQRMAAQSMRMEENVSKLTKKAKAIFKGDILSFQLLRVKEDKIKELDSESELHRELTSTEIGNQMILLSLAEQAARDIEDMEKSRQAANIAIALTEGSLQDDEGRQNRAMNSPAVRFFLNHIESAHKVKEIMRKGPASVRFLPTERTSDGLVYRVGVMCHIPKKSEVESLTRRKYRFFIDVKEDTEDGEWKTKVVTRVYIASQSKIKKMYRDLGSLGVISNIFPRNTATMLLLHNYVTNPSDSIETWFGCSHFVRSNPTLDGMVSSIEEFIKAEKFSCLTFRHLQLHILGFITATEKCSQYNFIQTVFVPAPRNDRVQFTVDSMNTYMKAFRGEDRFNSVLLKKFFEKLESKQWLGKHMDINAMKEKLLDLKTIPIDSILGTTSSNAVEIDSCEFTGLYLNMIGMPASKKNIDAVLIATRFRLETMDIAEIMEMMKHVPLIRMFVKDQLAGAREISINTPEAKLICGLTELVAQIMSGTVINDLITKETKKAELNEKKFSEFCLDQKKDPLIIELDGKKWNNCMDMDMFSVVASKILRTTFGYMTKLELYMVMAFQYYKHKCLEIPLHKFAKDSIALLREEFTVEEMNQYFDFNESHRQYVNFSSGDVRMSGDVRTAIEQYVKWLRTKVTSEGYQKIAFEKMVVGVKVETGMGQGIFSSFSSMFGSLVLSFICELLEEKTGIPMTHSQTSDDMMVMTKQGEIAGKDVMNMIIQLASCFNIIMSVQKCSYSNKPECTFNSCHYDFRSKYTKFVTSTGEVTNASDITNELLESKKEKFKLGPVAMKYIKEWIAEKGRVQFRRHHCKDPTMSRCIKGACCLNFGDVTQQRQDIISSLVDVLSNYPLMAEKRYALIETIRSFTNILMSNTFIYGSGPIEPDSRRVKWSLAINDPVPFITFLNTQGKEEHFLTASTEILFLMSLNSNCVSRYGELDPRSSGNIFEKSDLPLGFRFIKRNKHTFETQRREQQVIGAASSIGSFKLATKYISTIGDSKYNVDNIVDQVKMYKGAYIPSAHGELLQPYLGENDVTLNSIALKITRAELDAHPYGYLAFEGTKMTQDQVSLKQLIMVGMVKGYLNSNSHTMLDLISAAESPKVLNDIESGSVVTQVCPRIHGCYVGIKTMPRALECVYSYIIRTADEPHDVYVMPQERAGSNMWKGYGVMAQFFPEEDGGTWWYFVVEDMLIKGAFKVQAKRAIFLNDVTAVEKRRVGQLVRYSVALQSMVTYSVLAFTRFSGSCWIYYKTRAHKVEFTTRRDVASLIDVDIARALGEETIEAIIRSMQLKAMSEKYSVSKISQMLEESLFW